MYTLETNTSTYIIPLDHIDLNTIHTRFQQDGGGTKQLWSSPRNDQEYYRFELVARNTKDLEFGRNDPDYPTVTCYMCNIQVPSMYVKEHNNSKKHKLCLEIANTALQRVKDQMAIDDSQSSFTESGDGYFCEPCSIIVTDDHHQNTESHKSSLLHDKLLKDLLLIYTDKDNISKVDIKLPDEIDDEIKSSTDNKNKDLDNDEVVPKKRTRKCRTRNRNKREVMILDESLDDDSVNDYDPKVDNDPKSFKNYLRSLMEMFPDSPTEYLYINENFIQINIFGYKKMVFVDNFLGIIKDSTVMTCLMCSKQFVEESLEDHLYDFDHMQKVMAPVKDQECIRQIDPTTYYCILCACIITEDHQARNFKYYIHIQSKLHVTNDKGALIKSNDASNIKTIPSKASDNDKNKMAIVKTNKENKKIFCGVCKCNVDENDLDKHYKGIRHLIALKDNLDFNRMSDFFTNDDMSHPDTDISQSVHTDTDSSVTQATQNLSDASYTEVLNYQVCSTSNPKEVRCKVCDVTVPNTTTNIKDHTTGRNHKLKYNEVLASNRINRVDNNRYFCDFCKMEIPNKNELEHISGKNHQSKLVPDEQAEPANAVVSNSIKDDKTQSEVVVPAKYEKKTYCATCAVYIDTHNFSGHLKGGKHREMAANVDNLVQTMRSMIKQIAEFTVDAQTEMNNNVTTNRATEQNKLKSEAQTTAANLNSPIQTVPVQTNANTEMITNVPQENFLYQMKATENIKTLFCKICNVYVPNLHNDVKIHVNGFNHQNNYSILLSSNKIRKNGDKYICDICKVTVTRRNEIDHILGRNHQSNKKIDTN